LAALGLLLNGWSCSHSSKERSTNPHTRTAKPPANTFEDYLKNEFPVADGFDFAVGDADGKGPYREKSTGRIYQGWYVAVPFAKRYSYGIHTAEDWSGLGPAETDLGQDVHTVATGRVAFADFCGKLWGNVVMIDHLFYENNEKKQIRSVYAHLA
jgi:murein DD-endopeptidase MepM/ murein hydrolase activator NlpD